MFKLYIGLDVHKEQTSISLAFAGTTPPVYYGSSSSDIESLLRTFRKILKSKGLDKSDVQFCYEAGPCGFVIARRLLSLGFHVIIVAPSLIPSRSGDRIKTDRRDSLKLASLLRSGELRPIHIPDHRDEVIRDLCRARTDAVQDMTCSRAQLKLFLLRNGFHYTGKSSWSEAHMRYLRTLTLPDPSQRSILEEYLQSIAACQGRIDRLEKHMLHAHQHWSRAPLAKALQGFRGFELVASTTVISELGDLLRFTHPRQLCAFLGLVPSERTTSTHRRLGSITKTGNTHARYMLVECVRHYRLPPKVSAPLTRRQEGLAREITALSWRVQNRLHHRYLKLAARRLHDNKILVALARELSTFIWELARLVPLPNTTSAEAPPLSR